MKFLKKSGPLSMLNTLNNLPKVPGIYQYFDSNGHLLYVGKAKNLYNRVRSYFSFTPTLSAKSTLSQRIHSMISQAVRLEYLIVDSEHDALILENSLIKQLNPKYNILLRDDKTYPYIVIDRSVPYPRLEITRKVQQAKQLEYFGPFSVGARYLLDAIYEAIPLVQKKSCVKEGKACLYYQIKKCLAPCEAKISPQDYAKLITQARDLLFNKTRLIELVQEKMQAYAMDLRFEEAQVCKEQLEAIKKSQLSTPIDLASHHNYDIFAAVSNEKAAVVVRLFMREGKIVSSAYTTLKNKEGFELSELYTRSIVDFYTTHQTLIPKEVLVSHDFEDLSSIEVFLNEKAGHKVMVHAPKIGDKKRLTTLATTNANEILKKAAISKPADTNVEAIQELFTLDKTPHRIEIFDNSHMQGVGKVGAMVCYENNAFDKKSYRQYHLESFDEYGQMKETLSRRIKHFKDEAVPDLWLLDGGKALLNLAKTLLAEANVNLDVLAISKEKVDAKAYRAKGRANDIIWTKDEAFKLPTSDKRLQLLQKLRDEAHRFAISFHKKTKQKQDKQSALLQVKGIGPAKVKKLLNIFGSFESIRNATFEELSNCLNEKDAILIQREYKVS